MCVAAAILVCILAIGSIMSASVVSQTMEEVQGYTELSQENSGKGGFVNKLMSLPFGIKHIFLLLFTMIKLLPPLVMYNGVDSLSDFVAATVFSGNFLFWYVVFYLTIIGLVLKKGYKNLSINDYLLLSVSFLFLFVNTAHADIRRMMPIFPVLYVYYVRLKDLGILNKKVTTTWKKRLLLFYFTVGSILTLL